MSKLVVQKRFNGKMYYYKRWVPTKREAQAEAKRYREKLNMLIRIVPRAGGYDIYTRSRR